jgi:chlorophyllide a reductase subunit Z
MFGSFNERMYLAETGSKAAYIRRASPGAIIRRATGTPFMGYAAPPTCCRNTATPCSTRCSTSSPLGTELDKIAHAGAAGDVWEPEAQALLDARVEREPFLIRISAAKRLREQVEAAARDAGEARVTRERAAQFLSVERCRMKRALPRTTAGAAFSAPSAGRRQPSTQPRGTGAAETIQGET